VLASARLSISHETVQTRLATHNTWGRRGAPASGPAGR